MLTTYHIDSSLNKLQHSTDQLGCFSPVSPWKHSSEGRPRWWYKTWDTQITPRSDMMYMIYIRYIRLTPGSVLFRNGVSQLVVLPVFVCALSTDWLILPLRILNFWTSTSIQRQTSTCPSTLTLSGTNRHPQSSSTDG